MYDAIFTRFLPDGTKSESSKRFHKEEDAIKHNRFAKAQNAGQNVSTRVKEVKDG